MLLKIIIGDRVFFCRKTVLSTLWNQYALMFRQSG